MDGEEAIALLRFTRREGNRKGKNGIDRCHFIDPRNSSRGRFGWFTNQRIRINQRFCLGKSNPFKEVSEAVNK